MKTVKRNAVVLGVLFFVCLAVYLNWTFGQPKGETGTEDGAKEETKETAAQVIAVSQPDAGSEAGLYFQADTAQAADVQPLTEADYTEYFAAVRLARSQARDDAAQTLQVACSTMEASDEFVETATAQILDIAKWTMQEADLENLIMAKGFADCVVYMTENNISVTVPAPTEGLSDASVARITDVVLGQTDYSAEQITIVEIK